jgi:hypothetical protein
MTLPELPKGFEWEVTKRQPGGMVIIALAKRSRFGRWLDTWVEHTYVFDKPLTAPTIELECNWLYELWIAHNKRGLKVKDE